MTEQEIARIPEQYRVEIKVGDTTATLDVRNILFLKVERWPESSGPWIYLTVEAKYGGSDIPCDENTRHRIRTSGNNALDALVGILEKVDALNWDEKKECLHLLIKSNQ